MARKADLLFLKLAVKNALLDDEQARGVVDHLDRKEKAGQQTKARYVCVERGFMDEKTAKQLKRSVKEYLEAQAEKATTGRKIGNYAVEEKLGAGAMGIVYRARHVKLGRTVALKLLLPEFAQDDKYVERFEREARAAAQLNHPNVVQCFDAGSENDVVYIAMEFIDGQDVKTLVEKKGPLEEKQAVEIAAQVAKALEHASAAGLMHRDVKPANIMLTKEGRAKLLDLGLAKKIERDDASDLTEAGRAIGTPFYMAPEQAIDGTIDHRADLYSLGATLYFMLAGEPPFRAATPTGVLAKHVNEPVPSIRTKRPDCTAGVEKVINRMMAKKPEERYQEHEALVADLEALAQGFMPELKSQSVTRTPSRARTRVGSGATRSGSRVPAQRKPNYAFAAGILVAGAIGSFFIVKPSTAAASADTKVAKNDRKSSTYVPEMLAPEKNSIETSAPAVVADESALEQAARRQVDEAHRSGRTGWDLQNLLEQVGRSRAGTKAGDDAKREALALAAKLDGEEMAELEAASPALEGRARAGDVLGAADGYKELADKFHGDMSGRVAREHARSWEKNAEDACASADERAKKFQAEGHDDLAAAAIKATLNLRRGAGRDAAIAHVAELEQSASHKVVAKDGEKLAIETARVRTLAGELRDEVRARHAANGAQIARATAEKLETQAAKTRALLLLSNMEEIAQLETLAGRAFGTLKGQTVRLERRGMPALEGVVKDANDKGVSIEPRAQVRQKANFEDMDEMVLAGWVRRAKVLDEAKVAHLVAAIKTYRGDADAVSFAKASKDESLADLAAELGPVDEAAPSAVTPSAAVKNPVEPKAPEGPMPNAPVAGANAQSDKERFLYENSEKLFPGATQSAFGKNGPVAFYDFQVAGKDFRGLWKLESGTAIPNPPGQVERAGVSLRSSDGRALFDVPFQSTGSFRAKVSFLSYASLGNDSRVSLVLGESKHKERFEAKFGVLHYEGRRKIKSCAEPEDLLTKITTNTLHSIVLELKDGVMTAKLDDEKMGEIEVKDLGDLKVAFEWEKVNANVVFAEIEGTPTDDYVKKTVKK